jgi:hypothetical protein
VKGSDVTASRTSAPSSSSVNVQARSGFVFTVNDTYL